MHLGCAIVAVALGRARTGQAGVAPHLPTAEFREEPERTRRWLGSVGRGSAGPGNLRPAAVGPDIVKACVAC